LEGLIDGVTVNEYTGLDCNNILKSLVSFLYDDDYPLFYYDPKQSLVCDEEIFYFDVVCLTLSNALTLPEENLKIEIIRSTDLKDAVRIYGNIVFIGPGNTGSYVVLVIGLGGTIYVESGNLNDFKDRMQNEGQGANLSITRMNFKLGSKQAAIPNALFVVSEGIATIIDCIFNSASDVPTHPNSVTLYIADVMNNGKLILERCVISNMEIEGNTLIHVYDSSEILIKVCN
jgi:hypothetical protein